MQTNYFLTGASEFANVFLPLKHPVESDGHFESISGVMKELSSKIRVTSEIKSVAQLISNIAIAMNEDGFEYSATNDIYNEITELNKNVTSGLNGGYKPVKVAISIKQREFPYTIIVENNYYHLMGNLLSDRIENMKIIRDEGILEISSNIAEKLNLINGDNAKIATEYGNSTSRIKINKDLVGNIAYFRPTWKELKLFTSGLNINTCTINSKIERV